MVVTKFVQALNFVTKKLDALTAKTTFLIVG